jgi:epoxide hydrolase-like predicted phosphatase
MKIEAVIWDLGGVLVRTEDPSSRQRLADSLHLSRSDLEKIVFNGVSGNRAQLGEIDFEQHWENVRISIGLEPAAMEDFEQRFWEGDEIDFKLVEYVRSLRRERYKTGLLSNAFSNLRGFVTNVWEIDDAFDEIIISAEEGVVKPDPRIYLLALERLGIKAEQSVFIDDMPVNVEGARALGIHSIQFRDLNQARFELEKLLNGSVQ